MPARVRCRPCRSTTIGARRRDRGHVVVRDHLVVATERMRERMIARRGHADDFEPGTGIRTVRKADRRLARCGQHQHTSRTEPVVVGEVVFGQPAGEEQATQQRMAILGVGSCLVQRVAGRRRVSPVHGGVSGSMRPFVTQPVRSRRDRHVDVPRHWVPAVIPAAGRHFGMLRLDHLRPAHGRHATPARLAGRKEVPVAERVAGCGVGHRVRSECKTLDPKAYLVWREGRHLRLDHPGFAVRAAVDLQRDIPIWHRSSPFGGTL